MKKNLVRILSYTSFILVTALIIGVITVIGNELFALFFIYFGNSKLMIETILTIFILIELFLILFEYINNQRVEVERISEIGIISVVRELMFKIETFDSLKLLAIAAVLLVLGVLYAIEKKFCSD